MPNIVQSLQLFWRRLRTGSSVDLDAADLQKPLNQYSAYIIHLDQTRGEAFTRLAQAMAFYIERQQGTLIALAFLRAVTGTSEDVEEFVESYGPREVGPLEEFNRNLMDLVDRTLMGEFPQSTVNDVVVELLEMERTGTTEHAMAHLKDALEKKPDPPFVLKHPA